MTTLDERIHALEQSNATLRESIEILAGEAQALTKALHLLYALQEQIEADRRRNEITRRRVETVQRDTEERARRTRRALFNIVLGLAVALPLVSILVYVSLIARVNQLLVRNAADRIAACEVRNDSTRIAIKRERILAGVEDDGTAAMRAHLDSATSLEATLIDCRELIEGGQR